MLSDRNYISYRPSREDNGLRALFILIAIQIAIFFIPSNSDLYYSMELRPKEFRNMALWQPFTAIFLHADISHLLFNLLGLYFFGILSAPALGAKRFITLFILSGLIGNLTWLVFNWNGIIPLVGSSGGVCGVLMATAMLFPEERFAIIFLPDMPFKVKTLAIVYILIDVLGASFSSGSIAHLAHLGGVLAAYIYLMIAVKSYVRWNPLKFSGQNTTRPQTPSGWVMHQAGGNKKTVSQQELDRILDKISSKGINSLTEEETDTLRKAREEMKRD